ncbi:MAG: Unknown protein [uncultured Sulfurovum sp.]|uniref:Uncharacterized protein n=1 Tax=uncultured Sulfurovum sp. TaxID=269237 RepID=A0A6S6RWR9_9BACT|nr:MAG: Unknown protein [uncultured Sulfurovum sp.]
MEQKVNENDIQNIWERVKKGERVKDVLAEYDISRELYYRKCDYLGLKTSREWKLSREISEITKVEDFHDLAAILSIDYKELHKYVNLDKSIEANIKQMSYLKNNNPKKYQEAILGTIINYYELSPITLIQLINLNSLSS